MIGLLDKLLVATLYLNVLTADPHLGGLAVKKIVFALLVGTFLFAFLRGETRLPRSSTLFVLTSVLLLLGLAVVSLARGNAAANVMEFVMPAGFLANVWILPFAARHRGLERYARHLVVAVLLLAAFNLAIVVASELFGLRSEFRVLTLQQSFVAFSMPGGKIRVTVQTQVYYSLGLLLALALAMRGGRGRWWSLASLPIVVALYFNRAFGVWTGAVVALVVFLAGVPRRGSRLLAGAVVAVALVAAPAIYRAADPSKQASVGYKTRQAETGLALFAENPLVGKGIGYEYLNMDERHTADLYLEVTPVMVLASGGILGLLVYGFIYGAYALRYVVSRRRGLLTTAVFAAYVGLFVASLSNPYVWAGGIGFLYLSLLVAGLELDQVAGRPGAAAGASGLAGTGATA